MARKRRQCAYCGSSSGPTTREHFVPSCTFGYPLPVNFPTIPACSKCNHGKSEADAYFRDSLACDFRTAEHPIAKILVQGPIMRSIVKNQSRLVRRMLHEAEPVPIMTAGGICGGIGYRTNLDGELINKSLELLVRGCFWYFERRPLGKSVPVRIAPVGRQLDDIHEWWKEYGYYRRLQIGEGVFDCVYHRWDKDAQWRAFMFEFYGRIHFYAITGTRPKASY